MKIVIDTNILISAWITDWLCRKLLKEIFVNHEIFLCDEIIEEYLNVWTREKFKKYWYALHKLIINITDIWISVKPKSFPIHFDDEDDKVFLDTAITVKADYLVTWNLKDFPKSEIESVKIVSPRELYNLILG